ncbi:hypothetical protein L596_008354 [Steinernema carpocapsae]|uniref:Uncharacterized protein n=1 Tax=Steinernema carpocapsae TaxID=34508 RepID=A0A4U5PCB6_STECR|nr:hypothetical protein L596_008354 [Steinernema carpocapsae]
MTWFQRNRTNVFILILFALVFYLWISRQPSTTYEYTIAERPLANSVSRGMFPLILPLFSLVSVFKWCSKIGNDAHASDPRCAPSGALRRRNTGDSQNSGVEITMEEEREGVEAAARSRDQRPSSQRRDFVVLARNYPGSRRPSGAIMQQGPLHDEICRLLVRDLPQQ